MDPYQVLGVDKNATAEEIKVAYRRLSKTIHPDITNDDGSLFRELSAAYKILGDASSRKFYDTYGVINDDQDPNHHLYDQCAAMLLTIMNNDQFDPAIHDLVELGKLELKDKIEQVGNNISAITKKFKKLQNAVKRLKFKKSGKPSLVIIKIEEKIDEADKLITDSKKQITKLKAMLKIVSSHEFEIDPTPPPPDVFRYATTLEFGTNQPMTGFRPFFKRT